MTPWVALAALLFSSALQDAIRANNPEGVKAALASGAPINQTDDLGATPLHDAVWLGRLEIAQLLLDRGADVNAKHREGGSTPLHFAAVQGNAEIARLLIARKADLTAVSNAGTTSLHIAVHRGDIEMMTLLLEHSTADEVSLMLAKRPVAMALLLDNGKYTSQQLAARLLMAVDAAESEIALLLLKHGASAKTPGALPMAVRKGLTAISLPLLNAGADANIADSSSVPPLQDAALYGDALLIRSLMEHGAQINATDPGSGSTALYAAASMGKIEAVRTLLELGADRTIRSKSGRTPLEAAIASGFQEIAGLLR